MILKTEEIQNILNYQFKNQKLLLTAFTHKSYRGNDSKQNNERLEFLGDSILGFVVADYLYKQGHGRTNEGQMTVLKQRYVSTKPLANAIEKLGLQKYLLLGDGLTLGGTHDDRLMENLFEALVGALYLDGGILAATEFIKRNLLCHKNIQNPLIDQDFKSKLQIYTQSKKLGIPSYELVAKTGFDHAPQFTIAVVIGGKKIAVGNGSSKVEASKDAARRALIKISRQDI